MAGKKGMVFGPRQAVPGRVDQYKCTLPDEEMPWRSAEGVDGVLGRRRVAIPSPIDWNGCPLAEKYPTIEMLIEREGRAGSTAASALKPAPARGKRIGSP